MNIFGHRTWKDIPYESIPKARWPSRILWHAQRLMDEAKEARRAQRRAGAPVTVELLDADLAYQRACRLVQALRHAGSPGLTQAQLAAKAGVGLNTVRGIESDIGPMGAGVNNLEKVANALGVHVSELLK